MLVAAYPRSTNSLRAAANTAVSIDGSRREPCRRCRRSASTIRLPAADVCRYSVSQQRRMEAAMSTELNLAPVGEDGRHLYTCPLCEAMCGLEIHVSDG